MRENITIYWLWKKKKALTFEFVELGFGGGVREIDGGSREVVMGERDGGSRGGYG